VAAVVEGAPVATFDLDIVPDRRPRIVVRLLIAEAELDAAMAAVRRHLEDPHTLEIFTLYFQAWGRKA